jgi:hypothetical protein
LRFDKPSEQAGKYYSRASRIARPWLSHVNSGHTGTICRSGESRGVTKGKKHDSAQALE